MLHVIENEISLREWSGGTAQLRIFEEIMIISVWIFAVFTHFHVSFVSLENSVISVTKENFPRNRSNCFRRKKSPSFTVKLEINFSINLTSGFFFAFIFLQISQKKEKDRLECNIRKFLTCFWMHEANKNNYLLNEGIILNQNDKDNSRVLCNITKRQLDRQLHSCLRSTAESARFCDENHCV